MGRKRGRGRGQGALALAHSNTKESKGAPPPTLEQLATMRHLVGYIFSHELSETWRETAKLVSYIVAGNGIFTFRKSQVADTLSHSLKATIPGLPDLKAQTWLGFPLIPFTILAEIIAFFREVSESIDTEAYAQVWLNHESGSYWTHVPRQIVKGAHVEHFGELQREGHTLVLEIHSHGKNMDAFWSGEDNRDESRGGMRLFGVVGKVLDPIPRFKFRLGTGFAEWIDLEAGDVIEIPDTSVTVNVPMKKVLAGEGTVIKIDPFEDATYPDSWEEAIEIEAPPKQEMVRVYSNYSPNSGQDAFRGAEMRSDTHEPLDERRVTGMSSRLFPGEKLERKGNLFIIRTPTGGTFVPPEQDRMAALWRMGVREYKEGD
jgi:PRTRC genetic system protein A